MGSINTFKCWVCHGVFPMSWSDQEAQAEAIAKYGPDAFKTKVGAVCEDCYQEIQVWEAAGSPDERKREAN